MPNRTPTEAEVRASIRAELARRNAAVTPEQRRAALRARERGYGAEGSPYAARKPAPAAPAQARGSEFRRAQGTAQEIADRAAKGAPK